VPPYSVESKSPKVHPTRRWDLGDPAFDVTSEEVHRAREDDWYVETTWGWAVLRYAEVSALLRDRRFRQGNARWPEQNGIHSGLFADWWQETLLSLEGDDHARIRRLMVPAFKNRVIAQMRPTFQAIAGELIDAFAARGHVEFVHEFAEPYAARIICLLLGLPQDHWPQVARWADDLGASFSIDVGNQVPRIEAALDGLSAYVDEVVADRRARPREDLVSTLVQAQDADGALSDRELSVALVFLAFAGMETTRNQLGLALQTLLKRPDQWALLAERPDLGGNAVEEVMRVNPTVTWVTREALEDVDFQGLHIPRGGIVQMLSHAAGTDPQAVPDPSFDITEQRPPHHGFGAGIHHCLGHFVARTDMAVALPLLAQRMRDAECDGPGVWLPISGNTGAVSFPIRFRPEES
jgi:cytochrome P450